MAFKRTSKTTKIGKVRTNTTHNTKGGVTTSVGKKTGNQRNTWSYNSKTGKSRQITTRNLGNGWIERKSVSSSGSKVKPFKLPNLFGKPSKRKASVKKNKTPVVTRLLTRTEKIVLWSALFAIFYGIISLFT